MKFHTRSEVLYNGHVSTPSTPLPDSRNPLTDFRNSSLQPRQSAAAASP
jgi:hypothetical protein